MNVREKVSSCEIICSVLLIMTFAFLVFFGLKVFSPYTENIGPNTLVEVSQESIITIPTEVTFESNSSFTLQSTNKKIINSDKILPPPGEDFPHYVIVNPLAGIYQVTGSDIKVYSLEPTSIGEKNNILPAIGLMAVLVFFGGLVFMALAFMICRIIMGKDLDS
jgi:hypothetical protein